MSESVVSTDDREIAGVARDCGAEVPFERPPELADDFAVTTDVMAHAADWIVKDVGERTLESLCCIYPTAPLLLSEDLKRGLVALQSGDWSYAFSVTDFAAPIFRAFRQSENGGLEMFFPEHLNTRARRICRKRCTTRGSFTGGARMPGWRSSRFLKSIRRRL